MKGEDQRVTGQTWIAAFRTAFARVRRARGLSWEALGQEVAECWVNDGRPALQSEFRTGAGDAYTLAKANGQKLRRWLDDEDTETGLAVLNLAPALLAALPEIDRVVLLGELLAPFDLIVQPRPSGAVTGSMLDAFVAAQHDCAAVTCVTAEALADSVVEPREAKLVRHKVCRAVEGLQALADAADREGAK